jgi:hypothetical protein
MLHRIMMDMTQEIGEMAEQMSRGDLRVTAQASGRAHGTHGDADAAHVEPCRRPAMASPESQKQMEATRRRMEAMMRHARMTPGAKMSLPLVVVGAGLLRGRTVRSQQTQQAWWRRLTAVTGARATVGALHTNAIDEQAAWPGPS